MGKKFEISRFHIDSGPESLFNRARFVFSKVKTLKLHGSHARERVITRRIPQKLIDKITIFNCEEWNLKGLEVRNDTGKFVSSSWEYVIEDVKYWVVVGFHDTVKTIIIKDSSGKKDVIESGELYDFVAKVNQNLMEDKEVKEKVGDFVKNELSEKEKLQLINFIREKSNMSYQDARPLKNYLN